MGGISFPTRSASATRARAHGASWSGASGSLGSATRVCVRLLHASASRASRLGRILLGSAQVSSLFLLLMNTVLNSKYTRPVWVVVWEEQIFVSFALFLVCNCSVRKLYAIAVWLIPVYSFVNFSLNPCVIDAMTNGRFMIAMLYPLFLKKCLWWLQ